jgi:Family of unknown function (DUF6600)/FecR protein
MPCRVARLLGATLLLTFATAAGAEDVSSEPPAHVSYVDGGAVLERDGQPDTSLENMPILAGDRIRTEGGRVEILFADNSTLHLDANTTVDFQSDELVRLLAGRIRLSIPGPERQVNYRVDAPAGSVTIDAPGEYRVSMLHPDRDAEVELMVLRGAAELANDQGRTPLRAGQRALARGNAAPSYAYAFNSASWDAFDRWSEARRDQRLGVSTQYLPQEVRPYAASLEGAGDWRYDASYGYVWYPTVTAGWRPYLNGRWVSLRPYGWTWVGVELWGWPTHHYGRWGLSAGAWFWIPGRSWAPAWVSWAYAPGYVSWCPLGWNNRAVVQLVSVPGHAYYPWHAWTAVPYGHFGHGYVHVAPHTVYSGTVHGFVTAQAAPAIRGYAVPRSSAPIRVAGTGVVPRAASPIYTNLEPGGARVAPGGSRTMVGPARAAPLRPVPGQTVDSAGRAVAVPRESVGATSGTAYRARPGDPNAPNPSGSVSTPFSARSNSIVRNVAPGAATSGTAVRRGDGGVAEPGSIRADGGRTPVAPTSRIQPADGARASTAPYPYPQYGAQPRATPRDNPAYRPMPPPGSANNIIRTPAPPPAAGEMRVPDRPSVYGRPAPEMRTPQPAPEGARAVPRAEPGPGGPAPAAPPSGGAQHAAPAAQPAGGAPSGGGHARAGGRGR